MGRVAEIAERPRVVCLCGSTAFSELFRMINLSETLAGRIVLSIGCDTKSDEGLGLLEEDKKRLDELHLRKIDLADEIYVINGLVRGYGYVGSSTAREILYAWDHGKGIRWFVQPPYAAWHDPYPDREGAPGCQYEGCSQTALWKCDDGCEGWFFCNEHVFFFGYPMPAALVSK